MVQGIGEGKLGERERREERRFWFKAPRRGRVVLRSKKKTNGTYDVTV